MRTSLIISLVLLALTIGGGLLEAEENRILSERYVSAAEELHIMAEQADWPRAAETTAATLPHGRKPCRGCKFSSTMTTSTT